MNFFSTDAFCSAVAAAAFPRRKAQLRFFRSGPHRFRLLSVDEKPVTQFPFMDFVEPCGASTGDEPEAGWIPFAAVERLEVQHYRPQPDVQPAPTVDLRRFRDSAALWLHLQQLNPRLAADERRVRRKLEQECGAIDLRLDDDRRETYDAALRWKSAQYRASGLVDMFANPVHRTLFETLRRGGALRVSSLSAGGRLMAVHLGARDGRRFCSWIPAYDHTMARYSPGRQLLHALLFDCVARGDEEFDFLIGDEPYKWKYATHVRPVVSLGQMPLRVRAEKGLRRGIKATLQAAGLWESLSSLRHSA